MQALPAHVGVSEGAGVRFAFALSTAARAAPTFEAMTTPNHTDTSAATAATLYPEPQPPPTPTAPNAEVAAVRRADPARGFYSDTSCLGEHSVRELALAVNPAGTAEVLAKQGTELAGVLVDIGMGRDDLARLANLANRFKAKPPTAEETQAFHRTAVQELCAEYGDKFDQVFSDARRLAQRDPRFAALLNASGLGDHPWLVSRLAELGRTAQARGQLK